MARPKKDCLKKVRPVRTFPLQARAGIGLPAILGRPLISSYNYTIWLDFIKAKHIIWSYWIFVNYGQNHFISITTEPFYSNLQNLQHYYNKLVLCSI